mmetsp:Transcript_53338/g.159147  ORF Transcript_53338/g.159147 Transcript_53338/m.159147 type:complete len:240 (+) Transcript_53338:1401-2120(+)
MLVVLTAGLSSRFALQMLSPDPPCRLRCMLGSLRNGSQVSFRSPRSFTSWRKTWPSIGLYSVRDCASSKDFQHRTRSDSSDQSRSSLTKFMAKKRVLVSMLSLPRPLYQPRSNRMLHSMPASSWVSRRAQASKEPLSTSSSNLPAGTVKLPGLRRRDTSRTSGCAGWGPRRRTMPPARRRTPRQSPPPASGEDSPRAMRGLLPTLRDSLTALQNNPAAAGLKSLVGACTLIGRWRASKR